MARSKRLYLKRRVQNIFGLVFSYLMMFLGLGILFAVLGTLLKNGFPALSLKLVTEMTPPPGGEGGVANAIYGSVIMTLVGTLIGTPIGILSGAYLAEYGQFSKVASVIRFINGILLSAPSIIVGFFIYTVVVMNLGHFSAWAGALALAMILIPVVINNTENMLKLVPDSLREAAAALGAPRWKVITSITFRSAKAGIVTGVLLGIARISGETAPLLFTALNNQFFSTDMNKPMANLPTVIFQYAMSPYESWKTLAWGGALLVTAAVLALNVIAKVSMKNR